MAIIALDIGEKKIGVAISKTGIISHEYAVIKGLPEEMLGEIIFLVKREKIDTIVVGIPVSNNKLQEEKIRHFSEKLKGLAKIVFEDETLSTKEAERQLFGLGLTLEKVRERRDRLAAKIILDQYLSNK